MKLMGFKGLEQEISGFKPILLLPMAANGIKAYKINTKEQVLYIALCVGQICNHIIFAARRSFTCQAPEAGRGREPGCSRERLQVCDQTLILLINPATIGPRKPPWSQRRDLRQGQVLQGPDLFQSQDLLQSQSLPQRRDLRRSHNLRQLRFQSVETGNNILFPSRQKSKETVTSTVSLLVLLCRKEFTPLYYAFISSPPAVCSLHIFLRRLPLS